MLFAFARGESGHKEASLKNELRNAAVGCAQSSEKPYFGGARQSRREYNV